jgi:hypothetical protein
MKPHSVSKDGSEVESQVLGPRVVLAQGSKAMSKARPPACPGVPQRRARSAKGAARAVGRTARATVRRASVNSLLLFSSDATRPQKNTSWIVWFCRSTFTLASYHAREVDRLHVPLSRFRIANKVSWDVHGQQVSGCPAGYQNFFRKNRNILDLKSATCKFSNEKPIDLT